MIADYVARMNASVNAPLVLEVSSAAISPIQLLGELSVG